MSDKGREFKDFADVQQLLDISSLPRSYADNLPPSVQEKYYEIWDRMQTTKTNRE